MGQRVGYVRVSTVDQNTARQLDGVPLDKMFTDHASGKDTRRPQLAAAVEPEEVAEEGRQPQRGLVDRRVRLLARGCLHESNSCTHAIIAA